MRTRREFVVALGAAIFLTQGILKYIDPQMGVLRFTRIGFPMPDFTAHFAGAFEIVCGLLVLIGLLTRFASIPLLIVILTAIATTKIPELFHPGQGFWFMVSDADRLCDDDEFAFSDQRRWRRMVFSTSEFGAKATPTSVRWTDDQERQKRI